jgi:hypothetical protein
VYCTNLHTVQDIRNFHCCWRDQMWHHMTVDSFVVYKSTRSKDLILNMCSCEDHTYTYSS